jgi:hypothetical protein
MMRAGKLSSGVRVTGFERPPQQQIGARPKRRTLYSPVFYFLIALVVPWAIYIGPLRMSLYRIVLSVMILPCLAGWISGKAGRIRLPDIALLLFSFWCTLSLVMNNGLASTIQSIGIEFIETIGPYFLARCYVRNADDFYDMTLWLFRTVAFLLPFSIFECITGQNILRDLFALILPTLTTGPPELRQGLTRVRSVFDHPILFGVLVGSNFALVHLVLGYKRGYLGRNFRSGIVIATSFLSLSSGPLIGVLVQGFLLTWNGLFPAIRSRWKILIGISGSVFLALELVANRSPLDIFVSFFLYDADSYWFRKIIWDYGVQSVLDHPVFGVGKNEWERPAWMPGSIDNFWLIQAVFSGIPAALLLLVTFFFIFLAVSFKKRLDDRLQAYRTGFLISMTSFFLVGWTVAYWDAAYALFLFLLGSAVWMLDVENDKNRILQMKDAPGAGRAYRPQLSRRP